MMPEAAFEKRSLYGVTISLAASKTIYLYDTTVVSLASSKTISLYDMTGVSFTGCF